MDDVISIVNTRDNELEFDVNIRGANKKSPDVRFVIEDKDINYGFVCHNPEADKWTVNIPALPQLTKKAYPFRLEVIIDGYYFEPYRKTLNIVPEPEVKSGDIATAHPPEPVVTVVSVKKDDEKDTKEEVAKKPVKKVAKKPVKKRAPKKETEEVVEDILPIVEPVIEPETIEDIVNVDDSFSTMANAWLNREKPIVTEQDKKVKSVIHDVLEPAIKKEQIADADAVIIKKDPVVETITKEEPTVNEKDIKIRAILNMTNN